MQSALRPYVTAGVALVGASAIAVSPISVPPPEIEVHEVAVQLSASFEDVLAASRQIVQSLINSELENPAPILQQLIANQIESGTALFGAGQATAEAIVGIAQGLPAAFQDAADLVAAGDINGAINALLGSVVLGALPLIGTVLPQVQGVLERPFAVAQALVAPLTNAPIAIGLGPLLGGVAVVQQAVTSIQAVANAVGSGDPAEIGSAIQTGLADVSLAGVQAVGITLDQVNFVRGTIADALNQPLGGSPMAAESVPSGAAKSFTLAAPLKEIAVAPKAEVPVCRRIAVRQRERGRFRSGRRDQGCVRQCSHCEGQRQGRQSVHAGIDLHQGWEASCRHRQLRPGAAGHHQGAHRPRSRERSPTRRHRAPLHRRAAKAVRAVQVPAIPARAVAARASNTANNRSRIGPLPARQGADLYAGPIAASWPTRPRRRRCPRAPHP